MHHHLYTCTVYGQKSFQYGGHTVWTLWSHYGHSTKALCYDLLVLARDMKNQSVHVCGDSAMLYLYYAVGTPYLLPSHFSHCGLIYTR